MVAMLRPLLFAIALMPAIASADTFAAPRVRGGLLSAPVAYGDFIYVPSGISIEVWDASDAAHPTQIPFALNPQLQGTIFGLAVAGATLYVGWSDDARTTGGFEIYSLADPAHPSRIGSADTTYAQSLSANGDYLYEVDGQSGVTAIDASDPAHPVVAGTGTGDFLLPQDIQAVRIANGHMYVSGSALIESASAVIFDLADPAHPLAVGGMDFGEFGAIEAVSDSGYALVFGDSSGIYDVRDPANVAPVSPLPAGSVPENVEGFELAAFRGDDLYLFGGDDLPIIDTSTPAEPRLIADADIGTNDLFALLPLTNGFLAMNSIGRGILIDASAPAAPTISGEIAVPSTMPIVAATLDDHAAYVIGEGHALEIVDAQSLGNIGVLDAPTGDDGYALLAATSVGLSGSTAIIGGYLKLFAVDIADPAHPHVVDAFPLDSFGGALVSGDRAYVPTNDGALTIVDVSDPTALAVRGSLEGSFYSPLAASGSLVFVFGGDSLFTQGVDIVDARDATNPVIDGSYAPCVLDSFASLAISRDGFTIGVLCSSGSVEFVDASDPSHPTLVATYQPSDATDAAISIAAHGTTFYLGNLHGIDEIDASNPVAPAFVVRYPTVSQVNAIRLAPDGSMLALTNAGMYLFECMTSGERPIACTDGAAATRIPHAHSQHRTR